MKLNHLRTKRVIVPTVAAAVLLGGGGLFWSTASADDLRGGDLDRASSAALEAAGGGAVTDAETSDDPGETYEVEVRLDDGSEVDVSLDDAFEVVNSTTEAPEADGTDDDSTDDDSDERALTGSERTEIERAALQAVGGGRLIDAEVSDDAGEAFEAEVVGEDGTEYDLSLDAAFVVIAKTIDD